METYKKNEDGKLEVTTPIEVKEIPAEKKVYDYDLLKQQIINITAQRDEMIAIKEAELLEVQTLLKEADKLGIESEPVDEVTLPVEKPVDEVIVENY